jgi:hypothetical protein
MLFLHAAQEIILRVYTPQSDPCYQQAISEALERWCKRNFGSHVQMATPARGRQRAAAMAREVRSWWGRRVVFGWGAHSEVGTPSSWHRAPD